MSFDYNRLNNIKKNKNYYSIDLDEYKKQYEENHQSTWNKIENTTNNTPSKDGWFKSSNRFDDGYQFGDVIGTVGSSVADAFLNIVKGVSNVGEGIANAITYGIADINEANGNKEYANRLRTNLTNKRGITEEGVIGDMYNAVDEGSILGNKSDSVAQGIGNVGINMAIGMATGGGALASTIATSTTTGVSAFGSGMKEAYQNGATDDEAKKYGLISGLAEAGSELIFGGLGKGVNALGYSKGLSSLDDQLAKKVSGMFKSTLAKNLSEYAIKASAEGAEEVISGFAQAVGQKLTFAKDKDLGKLIENQDLMQSFITGAVTSALAQSPNLVQTSKSGADFITNLNPQETKVYEDALESNQRQIKKQKAINEVYNEETKGKNYTDTEKQNILQDITRRVEDGEIALKKLTPEEVETSEDFADKELARFRGINTEAQAEGYNGINQKTYLESAKKYGIDTENQAVQALQKFGENRGLQLEYNADIFKNNDEQSIWVDDGNSRHVYINPSLDNETALQNLAVHEMYHDTIGAKAHDKLTTLIMDKLAQDPNYKANRQSVINAYQGQLNTIQQQGINQGLTNEQIQSKQNALIDEEMTSKYLGENLGNQEFVNEMVNSTERSTIEKIIDWIDNRIEQVKNIVKGDTEAEYWRKVRENITKAYNSKYQGTEGLRYNKFTNNQIQQIMDEYNYDKAHLDYQKGNNVYKVYNDNQDLIGTVEIDNYTYDELHNEIDRIIKENDPKNVAEILNLKYNSIEEATKADPRKAKFNEHSDNIEFFNQSYEDMDTISSMVSDDAEANHSGVVSFENFDVYYKLENDDGREYYITDLKPRRTIVEEVFNEGKANSVEGQTVSDGSRQAKGDSNSESISNNTTDRQDVGVVRKESESNNLRDGTEIIRNKQSIESQEGSFNLPENVETTNNGKNLLAIHNLSADKLQGVLDLGGFPVPSIAITNPDKFNHSQYGDISVIFNKETINPENKQNEVYSRDIYSPRFPTIDYKVNNKLAYEIQNEIRNLSDENIYNNPYLSGVISSLNPVNLEESLRSNKGLEGYLERLSDNKDFQYAYLKSINPEFNTIYKDDNKIDYNATEELIDNTINKDDYQKWLKDKFSNIVEKKGIRNNKNYYTNTGTPRSFEQLHEDYTLNNVVKIMSELNTTGEESFFGAGFQEIAGTSAKRFSNIEDIRNSENLLSNLSDEEYQKTLQPISDKLRDIEKDIIDERDKEGLVDNYFIAIDSLGQTIQEVARKSNQKTKLTPEKVIKIFSKDYYNIDTKMAQRVIDVIEEMKSLPTQYFEAKPQRAVGFDEIDSVVIPSDTNAELKQQLKDRGINVIEYDSSNENARTDILKSLDEYKFNKKATSFDEYLKENSINTGKTDTIKDVLLPVKEKVETKLPVNKEVVTKTKPNLETITEVEEPKEAVMPVKDKTAEEVKIAQVLSRPIEKQKTPQRTWALIKANLIDKGAVFEDISLKTKNRELQSKWDATLLSGAKGQYAIGNARYDFDNGTRTQVSKALTDIIDEVGSDVDAFQNYMYHQLNVDRMTLEDRFGGDTGINYERKQAIVNKPVFGDNIGAEYSKQQIAEYEKNYPKFKEYAQDVYDYLDANKAELVKSGVISQELADKFEEMYPHYVPIARVDKNNQSIAVPLDTKRTGVNSPIKKAKGGSQDIQPLFQTMADKTLQTYRASARNSFGVELKNTLDKLNMLNQSNENVDVDTIMDTVSNEDNTGLTEGTKTQNPTFTVFENGEKVTYDINQDMYDALKPKNELLTKLDDSKLAKALKKVSNFRRGVLTEYNPVFSITNAIKDAQDVLMNSQHATKTYSKFPEAYAQILKKGYWYQEYVQNGGEQNSYFKDGDFEVKDTSPKGKVKSALKMPLEAISRVNNVIEMSPRLAEYIASREAGRSVETSMLDASRVTTNFKAGGDITKSLNRNGATFLNASVQGMAQNIRNIREANAKGFKGYAVLAGKTALAGLPALILNNLVWGDDDDYDDLQDYVKDNYYIIGKVGDHQFLRIPKGRVVAVIQKIVSNADEFINNKNELNADELAKSFWKDLKEDFDIAMSNVAPNNFLDNNIVSPISQAMTNKTWYGSDLVPTRLQDKPNNEQYDETTAEISKNISNVLNSIGIPTSPMAINYILDQYGGGVSDILLPMGTPQAENNMLEDKFTTNSVMKAKYAGDFFSKYDELTVNNNASDASDEDIVKYKYFSSIRGEISELYKEKREIQNSNQTDEAKKKELEKVQQQINDKTKKALEEVKKPKVSGNTATIGGVDFVKTKNAKTQEYEWKKVGEDDKIDGVSLKTYADYMNKTSEELSKQRKSGEISETGQLKDKDKIQILKNSNYTDAEKKAIYADKIGTNDNLYKTVLNNSSMKIDEYLDYKAQDFKADKDENGKTISGTAKQKTIDYINSNISGYDNRLLLIASEYKLTDTEEKQKLVQWINKQPNKMDIYKQLSNNFLVQGNKVYYK